MQPRVAVPQGDLGGIGPEIALAILSRPEVRAACRPLLLGHIGALAEIARGMKLDCSLSPARSAEAGFAVGIDEALPVLELESSADSGPPGRPSAAAGFAAVEAVLRAGQLCLAGEADLMATPPLSKESMHRAGYPYEGQTQILGELCRSRRYGMLACAGKLRVLLATRHMSLRQALDKLDVGLVTKQLRIAHEAAREVLGLESPRVALAGLNPHAGEHGAFGDEEKKILGPAIERTRAEWGFETAGPLVPDVAFREGADGLWDVVVALYHDQGFIPLKMLDRRIAYTLFVGGPILRVSPMHGTAFDRVRTGQADPEPFAFALQQGLDLCAARQARKASFSA